MARGPAEGRPARRRHHPRRGRHTALPESGVTLVAVTLGSAHSGADIGVGAALGGPLVVGTLAYGVTGAMLLLRRRTRARTAAATALVPAAGSPQGGDTGAGAAGLDVEDRAGRAAAELDGTDTRRLARDQTRFLAIFVVKVVLGLVAFAIKPWLGVLFLAAYAVYFWREMRGGEEAASGEELEPLKLQPKRAEPATWAVVGLRSCRRFGVLLCRSVVPT